VAVGAPLDVPKSYCLTDGRFLALIRAVASDAPNRVRGDCVWLKPVFALLPAHTGLIKSSSDGAHLMPVAAISTSLIGGANSYGNVRRVLEQVQVQAETRALRDTIDRKGGFENMIGHSQTLLRVLDQAVRVAPTNSTILIQGETGAGKELLARGIHVNSKRSGRPFVTLNCGAIPRELLESELFGHVRGSFSGAVMDRKGKAGQPMEGRCSWIYQERGGTPLNSINFVTCHDGFTLNDLVSFDQKHNEANGEYNRDGINYNLSWNCGVEGDSGDPNIDSLRNRQIRNFMAILLLSRGVPMFVSGDEIRRSQKGNNNAYCQDNEISWFDWTLVNKHSELLRFCRSMIRFRKMHAAIRRDQFFNGSVNERGLKDVSWHGTKLNSPGWDDAGARALAMTLAGFGGDADLHVMFNMFWESLEFELPVVPGRRWCLAVDTAQLSPHDIAEPGSELDVPWNTYLVEARSVVVLVNRA
jgi:hypothetical protein